MTDGELLHAYAKDRSETAFRELVNRHVDLVYSAARRQTHPRKDLAEDVSQLVFAELARKAPLLTDHPSIRGWLFVCTRHVAAKAMRAESRRIVRETAALAMNQLSSPPAEEWDQLRPVLDEVLCHLTNEEREAFFLRFFDKLSFADLGERLGVGEDAARRRVERLLERIRRLLARRGITSTATALGIALITETVTAAPKDLASGIAQAALNAASVSPAGVITAIALMKSIALSTTFIALVAVTGFLAGGAGLYFNRELTRDEASASAKAKSLAAAESSLGRIKRRIASSPAAATPHISSAAATAGTPTQSLEDQIARDLELSHWKSQLWLSEAILRYGPFLRQHGATQDQMQQIIAAAKKLYADSDDLREIAALAGTQVKADPDLLARQQQITAQYYSTLTGILGTDTANALNTYVVGSQLPSQNGYQTGEAKYVADQVAGTAFAEGSFITGDQKAQMTQLLLKYTPNYQPGDPNDSWTLNWSGIVTEAQATSVPASELAALQSFGASATAWGLERQAASSIARMAK